MIRNEKGFTIMELMIVIVIIGVLAAIAVPTYKGFTEKARATACEANRRTLKTGVMLYYAETGTYPNKINDTTANGGINEFIDSPEKITCPGKEGTVGDYSTADGEVYCTQHHPAAGGS